MKTKTALAALAFAAACAAPLPPATPSTPPPVPPQPPLRPVLEGTLFGIVRQPGSTRPAAHALVSFAVPSQERATVYTNEHGEYETTVEAGTGPETTLPVLIEATLGGASATVTARPRFRTRTPASTPERHRVDIGLDPLPPLTRGEAHLLIESFVRALNGEDDQSLTTYVYGGPEAFRTAVEDYRSLLGESIAATFTDDFTAVLRGSKRGGLSVLVQQDLVRRLHSQLLYYSLPSRLFIASFSRLVASGDAAALARLLTADDLDYPVERARLVIAKYKPAFETRGGRYELIDVDERRNTLTYRVTWMGEGQEKSADVVLRYGDGLLGLVDDDLG